MSRLRCYGWNAPKLSELTFEELNILRESVTNDPNNADPAYSRGGIYLYKKSARRKLDALAWAVTYKLAERRRNDPEAIR